MKNQMYAMLMLALIFAGCSKDDDGPAPVAENQPPGDFELIDVPNDALDVGLKPTLSWEEATDPDGDEVTYTLYLGTNPNALDEAATGITATSFTPENNLNLLSEYFWYVKANDGNGGEVQTNIFDFTTRMLKDAIRTTPSAGFSGKTEIHATTFDGKLWAIGGNEGNTVYNEVWFTEDGASWAQATNLPSPVYYHEVLAYDGKIWVLCGHDGSTPVSKVLSSTDGQNWNSVNGSLPARYDHTALVFDGKMWIIGGVGIGYFNDVYYSTDGQNWTQATANAAFSPRRGHSSMVFDGKMWVIGGYDASNYLNDIWYSSDGINWTEATAAATFSTRWQHLSMAYGGKMWVIAGDDGGGAELNDVWASTNGTDWTEVYPSAAFTPRRYPAGAVYDDKIWIIGGYDTGYVDDIWYME